MRLKLGIQGPFRISAVGEDGSDQGIRIVGSLKMRAMLGHIALAPHLEARREYIAALLWGDRSDAQARQNLRQGLLVLRRDLGDLAHALVVGRETIGLSASVVDVDALEMRRLGTSHDLEDLERVVALYRGPLLEDCVPDVPSYTEWLASERAMSASLASDAIRRLVARYDMQSRGVDALQAAERLIALDTLDESAQRLLIAMTARHGTRSQALAQARRFEDLLWTELAVVPDPETVALVAGVRSGVSVPSRTPEIRPSIGPGVVAAPGVDAPADPIVPPPDKPLRPPPEGDRRKPAPLVMVAGAAALMAGLALTLSLTLERAMPASRTVTSSNPPVPCAVQASRGATRSGGARGTMKTETGATCRFAALIDPENGIPPEQLSVTRAPKLGHASVMGNIITYVAHAPDGLDDFTVEGSGTISTGRTLPFVLEFTVEIR